MDILLKIAASKNKASPSKDFPSKEADPNQPLVAIMPEQVGFDRPAAHAANFRVLLLFREGRRQFFGVRAHEFNQPADKKNVPVC